MKIVRGRRDARWLPSRHNFALFRLAAYLRACTANPQPADVILIVDRHQSAFENYAVSVWVLLTLTCFVAASLFASWPVPIALTVALPVAAFATHAPWAIVSGLLAPFRLSDVTHLRIQSCAMMSCLLVTAGWFVTEASWVRFAAWQFLAFAILNAFAAAIFFFLRDPVSRLENALGGASSEP
jgi:hypothetical protein